ncbi:uncharacterized protein SCHCODRAFT_02128989 [Schizophyllum commune H4-8]|uniref:uncharacterized protein n=1 Tax=Schizophyllum commune (strain H4-8 / FGSC 9210) TaxID=578458 RepID=UPI00215F7AC1|nr:uncharacterized protein SCHCODRAFT_02128989 [Schizophyllum commune H4-8]KAI5885010.1 hypothetical protein SCHCODRAFT_02128989 [Schizophyllum commune H4-8]
MKMVCSSDVYCCCERAAYCLRSRAWWLQTRSCMVYTCASSILTSRLDWGSCTLHLTSTLPFWPLVNKSLLYLTHLSPGRAVSLRSYERGLDSDEVGLPPVTVDDTRLNIIPQKHPAADKVPSRGSIARHSELLSPSYRHIAPMRATTSSLVGMNP